MRGTMMMRAGECVREASTTRGMIRGAACTRVATTLQHGARRRTAAALGAAAALLLAALAAPDAAAQNMVESGDYVVHYNALLSTQLSPEVARSYSITRSPNRALLNVSVQRAGPDGARPSLTAEVQASATNLTGQRRNLAVREVREGDSIYYLSETGVSHLETLVFDVVVLPEDASVPVTLRFQQQFFTE